MKLNLFDADKAGHYIAGSAVAALAAIIALRLGPAWAWVAALAAGVLAGVAKEAHDAWANRKAGAQVHAVDAADAVATAIGALPVAAPLYVATLLARSV